MGALARPPAWWAELTRQSRDALGGLRVGVYGSGGAPYHHSALLALWGCEPIPVRAEDIRAGLLGALDALVVPGGGFTAMRGLTDPLGCDGAETVRDWVGAGGLYLSSCAGSFLPAELGEAYWCAHEETRQLHMVRIPLANGADSAFAGLTSPGVGTLEVSVTDPAHWLAEGLPARFELVHYNGPLFVLGTPLPAANDARLDTPEGVIAVQGATGAFTPSEAFMDAEALTETLLGRCAAQGAFTGVTAAYGAGQVVLFGSHPEFGFDVLQLGWGRGVRLLANALRFQAERRPARQSSHPPAADVDPAKLRGHLGDAAASLSRSARAFGDLGAATPSAWLEPGQVPTFMGRAPSVLWLEATRQAAHAAEGAAALAERLARDSADLRPAARWVFEQPLGNQDVGFMGLCQLAGRVEAGLEQTRRRLKDTPHPLAHAYDGLQSHPFHLAVGSYLSAAGLCASALLAAVTVAALAGRPDAVALELLLASEGA